MNAAVFKVLVVLVLVFGIEHVIARPSYRVKRQADNRLAHYQTKTELNKLAGVVIKVKPGVGVVDPKFVGRRRRSQSRILDVLFKLPEEEERMLRYNTDFQNGLYSRFENQY